MLQQRLNAALPPDLAVRSLRSAAAGFDPRRDAIARVYRYRIRMAGERRTADRHRTLEIDEPLDVDAMRVAAAALLGERDFGALGSHARGRTVRRVTEVRIVQRGTSIEVRVTANAFLRRMVRSIVALLIEAGRGRLDPDAVDGLLDGRRSGPGWARGAGPGPDPRAGHLSEEQRRVVIDPRQSRATWQRKRESRNREDVRSQGERHRAPVVGGRRQRPDPGPLGDAHRHPARGQAQAHLLAAPRHRRPRGGRQRRRASR